MTPGSVVGDLVDAAIAGRPVYISTLRDRLAALPPARSFVLAARLAGWDETDREFTMRLPRFELLGADERAMVTEYVLATLYNIISTLGGRGLTIAVDGDENAGAELTSMFRREFGIGKDRLTRQGYGRAVNVAERMDEAISPPGAPSRGEFRADATSRPGTAAARDAAGATHGGINEIVDLATGEMHDTAICGVDVGGTDIKVCLAVDGHIARLMEYDWHPADFTTIDEIMDPILTLIRLACLEVARLRHAPGSGALDSLLAPAFAPAASAAVIGAAVREGETRVGSAAQLDAIGVCFPDVVVRDRVVGGEVYKTRGIRGHLGPAYETEFRRLTALGEGLRAFVKPGGVVGLINDGPMAAFTAAVERGAVDPSSIREGVFAHTLGTELGTGWVTEEGTIPDLPLEIYNCVIDLGSYPERRFAPDDVRSVNNFNTRLPGTLQKYTSQSGVFRLAAKYLPEQDPGLFGELVEHGMLVESPDGLFVGMRPRDMRKPLLEHLMRAVEDGGHPAADRIFREVGEFVAVAWLESRWLLDPSVDRRTLFGRLVKSRTCFDLMVEGARSIAPAVPLEAANEGMANSTLMRELRDDGRYTVAQFAQAVGAAHYANLRRRTATRAQP